jgi:hypothetical protein
MGAADPEPRCLAARAPRLGEGLAPVLWLVAALAALTIGAIPVLAFGRLWAERR